MHLCTPSYDSLIYSSVFSTALYLYKSNISYLVIPSVTYKTLISLFQTQVWTLQTIGGVRFLDAWLKEKIKCHLSYNQSIRWKHNTNLPGSNFAISAQRFPSSLCAWQIMRSSSSVQDDFFTSGLRWLCQRSRHCLPILPFNCLAIRVQCLVPYFFTNSIT